MFPVATDFDKALFVLFLFEIDAICVEDASRLVLALEPLLDMELVALMGLKA